MNKKVSIIMPNYNFGEYIQDAIDSVLQQTYNNWELIIMDDGSEDRSIEIIEDYVNKYPEKIKIFKHPNNEHKGLSQTYQLGIKNATGEYIAFIESDDIFFDDSIALKVGAFEKHKDANLVYTDFENIGSQKYLVSYANFLVRRFKRTVKITANKPFSAFWLLNYNFIPSFSVVMVRKEVFDNICFSIPKEHEPMLDWWLWAQIGITNKFIYIPEKKTKKRAHKKSNALNHFEQRNIRAFLKKLIACIINNLEKYGSPKLYGKFLKMAFNSYLEENEDSEGGFKLINIEVRILKLTSLLCPFYIIRYLYKMISRLFINYYDKKYKKYIMERIRYS